MTSSNSSNSSNPSNALLGIFLLILSTVSLAALDSSGKWIMAFGLPLFVMSWMRYIIHLSLIFIFFVPSHGIQVAKTKHPTFQILRGLAMLLSTLCFFTSLHYLPQADATAISFLAPLIVLSIAPWILKEPSKLSRWLATIAGFLGILLIIRPGTGLNPIGVLFAFFTAVLFAAQYIITRKLASEHSVTTLIWSGLVGIVLLSLSMPFVLPATLPLIKSFGLLEWLAVFGTGFFGTLGHTLQIQAYRNATASLLSPFMYTKILSAALFGWLIWDQIPSALSWVGIAIVCASGIFITLKEWWESRN